jgi:outer membrane protein assembly factor BamB
MKSTLQPLSTLALATFFLFASSTFAQSTSQSGGNAHDDFEQTITKGNPHGPIEWTQYGFLPSHTGFNSRETTLTRANVASLKFQWAGEVGLGIASAPVVGQGIVYAAADGMIFAFRANDGTPLWSHLSCSGVGTVQPALGPHALLVGDGGGDLAAYDPVTGDQIWCRDVGGSITSAPAVDEKTVYITNGADVVALDQLTGIERWRFTFIAADPGSVSNTPAVSHGVVYVSGGNSVFAVDRATGHELWSTGAAGPNVSAPVVAGNTVYVAGGGMSALRASDGHLRWSVSILDNASMPAIAHNKVFVNSEDPQFGLFAFEANTGAFLWQNEMPEEPGSAATVANGVVFDISEGGGALMMFNSATGAFLGSIVDPDGHPFNANFGSQPAVVNGIVYISTADRFGPNRVDAFRLP